MSRRLKSKRLRVPAPTRTWSDELSVTRGASWQAAGSSREMKARVLPDPRGSSADARSSCAPSDAAAAPTQKPWTRQINAPSSAHIAVRRVGPGVRTRRARKGCSGWIRVTDTRSRCQRAAGTAHQQGRPRADTVTELTAGGHTEHRPAGESDRPHAWVTKQLRPTRKSVRVLHAHTALQESELARSGGGARTRPAGVGAGLPAKAWAPLLTRRCAP